LRIASPRPFDRTTVSDRDAPLLESVFRSMLLIRAFELAVNQLFLKGLMPGTIHLSHGQEAVPVGVCSAIGATDFITLTHRGHGQALAKGVSPRSLMAELFGRQTGCCKGRGGSLHVGDFSVGALPAVAIVGASSPIAAGMAFAFKRHGQKRVVCNFFGDGAVNEGDWHEAVNLAAVWKLPVVFVCENNHYGVSTHITEVTLNERLSDRAAAYGIPGVTINGNDVLAVHDAARTAVERARAGAGPMLVECLTYRRGGHKRDDPATYRPQEEVSAWLASDPIELLRPLLAADPRVGSRRIGEIEAEVRDAIADAVDFAQKSPPPDPSTALDGVYA
jgi:acetoin:2,6-dichlorophenolindophenol oxidoreductase subunit alpha